MDEMLVPTSPNPSFPGGELLPLSASGLDASSPYWAVSADGRDAVADLPQPLLVGRGAFAAFRVRAVPVVRNGISVGGRDASCVSMTISVGVRGVSCVSMTISVGGRDVSCVSMTISVGVRGVSLTGSDVSFVSMTISVGVKAISVGGRDVSCVSMTKSVGADGVSAKVIGRLGGGASLPSWLLSSSAYCLSLRNLQAKRPFTVSVPLWGGF